VVFALCFKAKDRLDSVEQMAPISEVHCSAGVQLMQAENNECSVLKGTRSVSQGSQVSAHESESDTAGLHAHCAYAYAASISFGERPALSCRHGYT
jgi:hypothetical protein